MFSFDLICICLWCECMRTRWAIMRMIDWQSFQEETAQWKWKLQSIQSEWIFAMVTSTVTFIELRMKFPVCLSKWLTCTCTNGSGSPTTLNAINFVFSPLKLNHHSRFGCRKIPDGRYVDVRKPSTFASFRPLEETVFIVHGFNGTARDKHMRYLKDGKYIRFDLHRMHLQHLCCRFIFQNVHYRWNEHFLFCWFSIEFIVVVVFYYVVYVTVCVWNFLLFFRVSSIFVEAL